MAANYGELKTQVATWLQNKADIVPDIPAFISGALARVNLELVGQAGGGLLDQEVGAAATLPQGAESLILPPDYMQLRHIKYADAILESINYNLLIDQYGDRTGPPERYAIQNGAFYFRPIPDQDYSIEVSYVSRYADFKNPTDTNFLLTNGGNLLLYAACLEAAPYLNDDPRLLTWERLYAQALRNLINADRQARRGPKDGIVQLDRTLTRQVRTWNIVLDQ